MSKKVLIITDAYHPQTNGVVTTITNVVNHIKAGGDKVFVYHSGRVKYKINLPFYPEIKLAILRTKIIKKILTQIKWDYIHIATLEGSLGFSFMRVCKKFGLKFSVSCHTKFPEYVNAKIKIFPISLGWKLMAKLYNNADNILTTTESMKNELLSHGFQVPINTWSRGVKRDIFYPNKTQDNSQPVLVCVARVSSEKNLKAFFDLEIAAKKIMVGVGPDLEKYQKAYPQVEFVGLKKGQELAKYYQNADCFVFPSLTDTFGVVLLEAIACGTPVAAYPTTGPIDIINNGENGYLDNDLLIATQKALTVDRKSTYESSKIWSWQLCYGQFMHSLVKAS
jgi:glycosyltransferase involved in cell wall biosynthesis